MKEAKKIYTVNVGNIGNIQCANKKEAIETYNEYVRQSFENYGCAAGESVVLFEEDKIIKDYIGRIDLNDAD